jgi:hypothetical protein
VQVSVMQGAVLGRSRPVVAISKTDLIADARLGNGTTIGGPGDG